MASTFPKKSLNRMNSFAPCWALGCMSGTSMDGVDAAMLLTDGEVILEFGDSGYLGYSRRDRETIARAQGVWPGMEPETIASAERAIHRVHRTIIQDFQDVDIIGFHGQTVAHDPKKGRTHQIGNGNILAEATGTRVAWDFRRRDMAAGGQGAPLAPIFHRACARYLSEFRPVVFLNLGGVGNLTYVDLEAGEPVSPGAVLAFDTGPGNALLDDLMMARRGSAFDRDGALAGSGSPDTEILKMLLTLTYFDRPPPKSLDRNDFSVALRQVRDLSDADAAATLTALTAISVARAQPHLPRPPSHWLVSGGGSRNPVMMSELQSRLDAPVRSIATTGLDPDMLEANAFAFLGVRVLRGLPISFPSTTGCREPTTGGRLSLPKTGSTRDSSFRP